MGLLTYVRKLTLILIDSVSWMRVMGERMLDRFAECNECMRGETVKVKVSEMSAYMRGVLMQDAFPDLSDAELNIVNGSVNPYFLCNTCWDQLMVDEDEC
tara:strand:- start:360 stop:659 length:300 start_codon:yes stop_codon:yes gene_type:complete